MLRALIVAALLAAIPSVAYPCMNAVTLSGDEAVKTIVRAETLLERGKYRQALSTLTDYEFEEPHLDARATDVKAVYAMRMKTRRSDLRWVVARFKARSESHPKDVRLRARLAEAYEATGDDVSARAILLDLDARDLMPDAFAYRTLARVTSGTERTEALETCNVKAKNKSICTTAGKPTS